MENKIKYLLKIVFILLGLSFKVHASSSVAMINKIAGNVFSININGNTEKLSRGSELFDNDEIMTEEGSFITFTDYKNHRFQFSGGGHLKFKDGQVILKRGYVRIISHEEQDVSIALTANAIMNYTKGDFILSFDSFNGKSQLLVVKGSATLANLLNKNSYVSISQGKFSYVDNQYQNGIPRNPTPIGVQSFNQIASLFDFDSDDQDISKKVAIDKKKESIGLPVVSSKREVKKQNSFENHRIPASKEMKANKAGTFNYSAFINNEVKKIKKHHKKTPKVKLNKVKINIFGHGEGKRMPSSKGIDKKKGVKPWKWQASVRKRVEKKSAHRAPASILSLKDKEEIKLNKNFEKTFLKSFNSQARHPQEVNQLIDDLKSYKNDYTKNY